MSLQLIRFNITDGLDLKWEANHRPRLLVLLSDPERDTLIKAGGPGHWSYFDIPLAHVRDYLFRGVQPMTLREVGLAIARGVHGRVRLSMSYRREAVAEREYPEKAFHAAFRICKHVTLTEELFTRMLDTDDVDLKDNLLALAREEPTEAPSDPQRAAWERVWADSRPIASKEVMPTPICTPPPALVYPAQLPALSPAPSSTVPPLVSPPTPISLAPQRGPLQPRQLRLYADALVRGGDLPTALSPAARAQITAYAETQGLLPTQSAST